MLFKILTILLFFSIFLQASEYNLTEIKKDFYKNVVLKSPIKNRNKKFRLTESYFNKAKKHLLQESDKFTYTQFVALVDLSKQVLILTLWDNTKKDFFPIGFDFVSTGDIDREGETKRGEDHYVKTPSGIFGIKSGWRSDGKVIDDNVTKPYGSKGRFVFYFGKQNSIRYNTFDKNGKKINDKKKWTLIKSELQLAMHAHTSQNYFGQTQSHGCIRISEAMNIFLDNNFVFFSHLLLDDEWIHPYEAAPKTPKNHKLAGKYLVIIDSAS